MQSFEEAIRLEADGDGRFRANVAEGWDIRGIPHGGYLLSVLGAAAAKACDQSDPVSIAANYLQPPVFGAAEVSVDVVRAGKRQATARVELAQGHGACVIATVTVGTMSEADPVHWMPDVAAPEIAPPEECLDIGQIKMEGEEPLRLHERVDLRLIPETGWLNGAPRGVAELQGWLRLKDSPDPGPLAMLLFTDALPPSIFEATGRDVGHVPTVQLTTHLFANPAPGWIQCRFRTRVQGGGFVDEDGELWDSQGRLVATTRQLALLR